MNFLFPVLDLYLDIIDGVHRYIKVLVSFLAKRWNFCQFIFQLGQKLWRHILLFLFNDVLGCQRMLLKRFGTRWLSWSLIFFLVFFEKWFFSWCFSQTDDRLLWIGCNIYNFRMSWLQDKLRSFPLVFMQDWVMHCRLLYQWTLNALHVSVFKGLFIRDICFALFGRPIWVVFRH